eukprot:TRINITY_DN63789_c0_g1_i1.p1 TRINITY_DN63789_c0_g1~~TRINITY_DN63789_c0_g1_i1.p1  ORF type:complete len:188 (-),score=64.84 TRINITY_DN63789_c0_g1_i1:76-639(-)
MPRPGNSQVKKHAPYFDLIREAIKANAKPAKGASRQSINAYIAQKYGDKLGPNFATTLKVQLRRFVNDGKLVQSKGPSGSFRVNKDKLEKPKKKKAAKKKTSTKKKTTDKKKKSSTKKKTSSKSKTKSKSKSSGKKATKPKSKSKAGDKRKKSAASKTKKPKSGSKAKGKRASSPGAKRQKKLSSKA